MAKRELNKNKSNLVKEITKRYNVTAREARDIVTAVGTVGQFARPQKIGKTVSIDTLRLKAAGKNLKTQVKETGRAAVTGQKGTRSKVAEFQNQGESYYGKVIGSSKKGRPSIVQPKEVLRAKRKPTMTQQMKKELIKKQPVKSAMSRKRSIGRGK
jgi:hypothetical protein